ncbi:MAG: SCP2 sterol-binding domain-containing protein, partial [Halobacteria archaeon]|nr:SCP2 sterol-binding domain-containing protein [Halobacteria archaeon]
MPWFPTEDWLEEYQRRLNASAEFQQASRDWGINFNGDYIFKIENLPIDEYRVKDLPDEILALENMPDAIWEGVADNMQEQMVNQMGDMPVYQLPKELPDPVKQALPEKNQKLLDDVEEFFEENPTQKASPRMMSDRMREVLPPTLDQLIYQLENYVTDDNTVYTFVGLEAGKCTEVEIMSDPNEREAGFVLSGPYRNWKKMVMGNNVIEMVMGGELDMDGDMTQLLQYTEAATLMGDIS